MFPPSSYPKSPGGSRTSAQDSVSGLPHELPRFLTETAGERILRLSVLLVRGSRRWADLAACEVPDAVQPASADRRTVRQSSLYPCWRVSPLGFCWRAIVPWLDGMLGGTPVDFLENPLNGVGNTTSFSFGRSGLKSPAVPREESGESSFPPFCIFPGKCLVSATIREPVDR